MFDRGIKTHIIATREVHRPASGGPRVVKADVCVLGAGISGVAAALESAKLGRKVIIVDGAPSLGGQAIGSIIGTLIGLYSHGPNPFQVTHGIADELVADLDAEGSLVTHRNITVTYQYDEVRLARWIERKIQAAGVQAIVGAVLTGVGFSNRRVTHIDFATRYGAVRVEAQGFVDASQRDVYHTRTLTHGDSSCLHGRSSCRKIRAANHGDELGGKAPTTLNLHNREEREHNIQ